MFSCEEVCPRDSTVPSVHSDEDYPMFVRAGEEEIRKHVGERRGMLSMSVRDTHKLAE